LTSQRTSSDTIVVQKSAHAVSLNTAEHATTDAKGDQKPSFWDRFRLAEVAQGQAVDSASDAQGGSEAPVKLDEIVVTAQKREERIQDVPFAITAVSQREIRERGAVDIKDLQYSIPGLNIQELQPGANRTTMRGINPGISTGLPIVAVYVDEVGINL